MRCRSGNMLKVWLSPSGFAEKCSPTAGFPTVRLPRFGSRRSRIDGESEFSPGVDRRLIPRAVGVQKPAARERAHFGSAEALKQRHAPLKIGVSSGLGADQHQL